MSKLRAFTLVPLLAFLSLNILVIECEMSIYPGLRRRPVHAQLVQQQQQPLDVSADFLAQLMEENARRRLQQQFEQQLELINLQRARHRQRQERLRERIREQQLQLQRQRLQELGDTNEEDDDNDNDNDDLDYANSNTAVNSDNNNNNNNNYEQYDNANGGSDLSYKYAKYPSDDKENSLLRQRIQFAVGPSDPRFYLEDTQQPQLQNINDVSGAVEDDEADELDSKALEEYEEYVPAEASNPAAEAANKQTAAVLAPAPLDASKHLDGTATFHRIKPQTAAAAAVAGVNIKQPPTPAPPARHDINALIDKLQREGNSGAILNNGNELRLAEDADHQQVVVRQHMGMSDDMGMYLVALIAGVSAATTVGLIALGVAWIHSKAKAAADVDYPAYGITGPNKDISPSGDRKLAQSAQMYHYQHQKQQIIAMENRQAAEGNCGLSDVESDDDNEEGDYTVYECPGLAPTGEMEVKNPLFLDETPMTPAGGAAAAAAAAANTGANNLNNNITQATPQQPPQQILGKKGSATKAVNNQMNTSSEGNNKNNKTKKQDKK